ncbi:MAG: cellulase family glycosylhydrolase, partial [Bdellovibrionales bacterium]|nr:cellulase family glycosylhydrolase [Bdellovibrionales bacterium]
MKFLVLISLLFSSGLFAQEDFLSLNSTEARNIVKSKKTINGQTDFVFRDGYGREVHLRGTNMTGNTKHPELNHLPFKDVLQSEKEASIFKMTTGGNFVRWLFVWEGPHKDVDTIDYDHLDHHIAQMRSFMKRGVFILIDFHQDLFSRHIKDGSDGAPKYIVQGMNVPQTGCGKICPTWSVNYITNKGVRQSFAKFWKNEIISTKKGPRGVQDEFFYMLEKTFSYFKKKFTPEELSMIVGLDPMNEPTHGYFDRGEKYNGWVNNKLFPFYERARATLDSLGFENVFIFAEPGTFWNVRLPLLYAFIRPSGPLKLNKIPKGNWVFNAHTYDEVRESYGLFKAENGVYLKEMELVRDEARKMAAPAAITEFGAWLHSKKKWVFDPHRLFKANYQAMEMSMSGKKKNRRPDYYTPL